MKNLHDSAPLKLDAFEAALRSAEPNLLLAAPWLLQLVISHSRGALPTGLQTPDEQLCVIARERLLRFIEDQELPLPADLPPGPTLILLEKPDKSWLEQTPAEQALLKYWRLMVRATVESRLRQVIPAGTTSAARVELASRVNRV